MVPEAGIDGKLEINGATFGLLGCTNLRSFGELCRPHDWVSEFCF